jgi:hypothetical protein
LPDAAARRSTSSSMPSGMDMLAFAMAVLLVALVVAPMVAPRCDADNPHPNAEASQT